MTWHDMALRMRKTRGLVPFLRSLHQVSPRGLLDAAAGFNPLRLFWKRAAASSPRSSYTSPVQPCPDLEKRLMRLVLDDASCFSSCPKTVSTADPWPPPRQPRQHRRAPPQRSYMSPSVRDSAGASCRHGPEDDSPRETKCNTPFYMSSVIVVMASVSGWRAWMFTDRAGWSSPCITTSDQLIASFRGEKS